MMIIFGFFAVLGALTFVIRKERAGLFARSRQEWLLDWSGLVMQGAIVPALRITVIYAALSLIVPSWKGALDLSAPVSFLLCFVVVDYLYYWNHRFLHHPKLWFAHKVHHSAQRFDFIISSRNTFWTPFLLIYLWVNGFFLFILKDPGPFAVGAALTAGLDLWRHTNFSPRRGSWLERGLSPWLILPADHIWHHGKDIYHINYGANFKLWDRLHGTSHASSEQPQAVGVPTGLSLIRELLWPFKGTA